MLWSPYWSAFKNSNLELTLCHTGVDISSRGKEQLHSYCIHFFIYAFIYIFIYLAHCFHEVWFLMSVKLNQWLLPWWQGPVWNWFCDGKFWGEKNKQIKHLKQDWLRLFQQLKGLSHNGICMTMLLMGSIKSLGATVSKRFNIWLL